MSALAAALDTAFRECAAIAGGTPADYIPELSRVDPGLFALASCDRDGVVHTAGSAEHRFTLQSASKPFVYGWALELLGTAEVHSRVGVEPTGDTFDSIIRLEESTNRPHNPMINAGAIAVTARLVEAGVGIDELLARLGRFAGRELPGVDESVFRSEWETGHRNLAIAYLMRHFGILRTSAEEALELYVRQCAVQVDCRDLAVMAATLAGRGVNPLTGERVLGTAAAGNVLSVLSTCGMYDASGRFAFEVGAPAKSGVSGALFVAVPGRFGLAAFSPPLDAHGNSVRGLAAVRQVCEGQEAHGFRCAAGAPPAAAAGAAGDPPGDRDLEEILRHVHRETAGVREGAVADYIAPLAGVDPELFGLAVCTVDGREAAAGDADAAFTLQAAANAFTYARVRETVGRKEIHRRCGLEPSGNPFNAIVFDPRTGHPYNPLGNAGAILMASLLPGSGADRAERSREFLRDLGGEEVEVDPEVLRAERAAGDRNRAIAHLLRSRGLLDDPEPALEAYWNACSVRSDCRRLARLAAVLAACGTARRPPRAVLHPETVRDTLTLLYTCGLHDESGRFAFNVGLPAKSGISGAMVAVIPGRMGVAVFSPRVNRHGSSVRALIALRELSSALGAGVFAGGPPC